MLQRQLSLAALCCLALTAGAAAQPTVRVSVSSSGEGGHEESSSPAISADGRFVAFTSLADNLVPNDGNNSVDVFLYDRVARTTTRVSLKQNGDEALGDSFCETISPDGTLIVFTSAASGLVSDNCCGSRQIYLRDLTSGKNERISVSDAGDPANQSCFLAAVSSTGRYVAFVSYATNLVTGDTNGQPDVFVRDRVQGTTIRISVSSSGGQGNGDSYGPAISADGRLVVFWSNANNLVPGDTNQTADVFCRDLESGETTLVSVAADGKPGNKNSYETSITGDGRFVTFTSEASNLVAGDTNATGDIFLRDLQAGTTQLVSVDSQGVEGSGYSSSPGISPDGRYVAFTSLATNFVPDDHNDVLDVYVHDLVGGATTRASVSSRGKEGNRHSWGHAKMSAGGRYVAYFSDASNLVPDDGNDSWDVFLRDRLDLTFDGVAQYPNDVRFRIANALEETGHWVLVMISCTGDAGFALPDGRKIWVTLDAHTLIGLRYAPFLLGVVDKDGFASTASIQFPPAPPGLNVYCAAFTMDPEQRYPISITGPTLFVSQ